jgi:hypothetical protein
MIASLVLMLFHGSEEASGMSGKTTGLTKLQWLAKQADKATRLAKQDCHDPDAEIYWLQ